MGFWRRFYGLQHVVILCCQIKGTAGGLVIRTHPACCVCVMALMYLFMSLAYNYAMQDVQQTLQGSAMCYDAGPALLERYEYYAVINIGMRGPFADAQVKA